MRRGDIQCSCCRETENKQMLNFTWIHIHAALWYSVGCGGSGKQLNISNKGKNGIVQSWAMVVFLSPFASLKTSSTTLRWQIRMEKRGCGYSFFLYKMWHIGTREESNKQLVWFAASSRGHIWIYNVLHDIVVKIHSNKNDNTIVQSMWDLDQTK